MRFFQSITIGVLVCLIFATPVSATSYPDVSSNHPHYTAISALSDTGIVQGYPNGEFHPEGLINRAEAVKILIKTLYDEETIDSSLDAHWAARHRYVRFPDVLINEWFGGFVEVAYQNTVVEGYPDGTFKPANNINFAEALKVILEANQVDLSTAEYKENKFILMKKGDWFAPYFTYAYQYNLINQNKFYHPAQLITRGEFVEVIYRLKQVQESGLPEFITDEEPTSDEYTITIPKLNIIDLAVNFANTSDETQALDVLKEGLGHYLAPPSDGRKMILFGHSSGYSWDNSPYKTILAQIDDLAVGDRIYLNYHEKGYVYEIFNHEIIAAKDDYTLLEDQQVNELALYTCWPPNQIGQRYVVYGKPV
jgi:LPXTG-site transpeptidase (sortase) family protein